MLLVLKRTMQILILFLALGSIGYYLFSKQDKVGKSPSGARLKKMQEAPNYRNGAFENLEYTPALAEGASYLTVLKKFFFGRPSNAVPSSPIPHVKTNLIDLPVEDNLLIWFGHSSYYLQLGGKRILVDPVFSGNVSPINNIKAFAGSDIYSVPDMPEIDLLIITHDHWDHLDYETVKSLQPKVKRVITGLGVGAHLEAWGYPAEKITEMYWGDQTDLAGLTVHSCTARHFSGRMVRRNTTLWSSFVLKSSDMTIYVGGDSGYGKHFKEIGQRLGPFDLAILENGQYNESWRYIHLLPEEVVTAAKDLQAKRVFPVHNSKFVLSVHAWNEPHKRLYELALKAGIPLITPKIGEVVFLKEEQAFERWWEES